MPFESRSFGTGIVRPCLAVILALSCSTGLSAQTSSDITVTAPTADEKDRVRAFIGDIGVVRLRQQVARWTRPVCPKVYGLPSRYEDRVRLRVRAIAEEIGAPVAEPSCEPNIGIVFTQSGTDVVDGIRKADAERFQKIPRHRKDFVFESDAPIRWWYTTERGGRHGERLSLASSGLPGSETVQTTSLVSSRLTTPTTRWLRSATVVIDTQLASGKALDDLTDYAALVALAEIWPSDALQDQNSVLRLFDLAQDDILTIGGLGEDDRAFLCSLYSIRLDRSDSVQKKTMARYMVQEAGRCPDPDRGSVEDERQTARN